MTTISYIISGILVGIVIVLSYIVRNLLYKVEKYEDISTEQTDYLIRIDKIIRDSQMHLQKLDEKGVFQSDDEVGYFFNNMKDIQKELDSFKLPKNYGKEESKS